VSQHRPVHELRHHRGVQVVDEGVFARAWAVQPARFAWLLGAGSSAAAGVPTAARIIDDLLLRLYAHTFGLVRQNLDPGDPTLMTQVREYYDGANGMPPAGSNEEYSAAFAAAMPDANTRRAFLRDFLNGRRPSYGQRVLGAALATGSTELVLTTNFDDLIEVATADARTADPAASPRLLSVASLHSAPRAQAAAANDDWPLLIKLHGDFRETPLKNLTAELQDQDATLRRAVIDSSRRFGLAIAGYSGRDASIMTMLEQASSDAGAWPAGLWWLTRSPEQLPERVQALLEQTAAKGIPAYAVRTQTFDETMAALADQAELPTPVRHYVDALRPPSIVSDAPVPSGTAAKFPILRLNALAVIEAPQQALRAATTAQLTGEELNAKLREHAWRGSAVLGAGHVLAWGRSAELQRCLEASTVEHTRIDVLADDAPSDVLALASEALIRSLARQLPARPSIRARGSHLRLVPATDEEADYRQKARATIASGYATELTGHLPPHLGRSITGNQRAFAEAIRVRLERADGRLWMIFLPFTWVEPSAETVQARKAGALVPVDPAGDWNRERWVQRKRNENWAALIAGWANALAPHRPTTRLPVLPRSLTQEADALGGHFVLDAYTAHSRPTA
jgi:hypothetical protein